MEDKIAFHLPAPICKITIESPQSQREEKGGKETDSLSQSPPSSIELDEELKAQLQKKAFERGYAQGVKDAKNELQILLQTIEKNMEDQLGRLREEYLQLTRELEGQTIALILEIVEYFLQKRVEEGKYDIQAIVQRAFEELRSLQGLEIVAICCNPDDLKALQQSSLASEKWKFMGNAEIPRGDCLIETNLGQIVVSLKERIRQLDRLIREV